MKRWKVKERFVLTGWTYIDAETEEAAIKSLEDSKDYDGFDEDGAEWDHKDTLWDTLVPVQKSASGS